MAKDEVTGKFGADDIVLTNAATEATLQQILKAVDRNAAGQTAQAKKQKAAAKGFVDKLKHGELTVKDFSSAMKTASRTAVRSAGRGLNHVADAAIGLTEEFVTGSARISDFSSHLTGLINQLPIIGGLIGAPLQLFASFMDNNIDTFRGMSAAGIMFSNSVVSVTEAATRSGLSLDVFANAVGSSSNILALLEGNAQRGAERFVRLSDGLRESRERFSTLGLTMEDTTEFMSDYLAIQTRLGRSQTMTDNQLIEGTEAYILQLDRLAKITGIQRSELSKQMESAAIDERLAGFLAGADDDVRKNVLETIAALESISPELAEAFKGLIATGGAPMNDLARSLLIADSSLGDLARSIGTGGADATDVLTSLGRAADGLPSDMLRLSSILPQMGNNILGAFVPLLRFSNAATAAREALEDQESALNQGSRGLLAFEQNVVALRNTILGTLINSGIFGGIEERFNSLMENIDATGPFFTALTGKVQQVVNWIDKWIFGLIEGEKTLNEVLSEIGDKITEGLSTIFRAGVRIIGEEIKNAFKESPGLVAAGIAVMLGPTAIAAVIGGIGKLFGASAVIAAMTGAIAKLFATGAAGAGAARAGTAGAGSQGGAFRALGAMLGRVAAPVTMALGAFQAGRTLSDNELTREEKGREVSGIAGGTAGALAGMKAGAALGLFGGTFAPITVPAGALIGGGIGYFGGGAIGKGVGSLFFRDQLEEEVSAVQELSDLTDLTPSFNTLTESVSGFEKAFNNLDLNTSEIDRTNQSLEKMVEQLKEINTQLQTSEQEFGDRFNNRIAPVSNNIAATESNRGEKLEEINTTLIDILRVLMQTYNIDRRQLNATRTMTSNLYTGL